MNDSRRAALTLRDRMNALNAEISENRKALLTADAAQKAIIDTRNRAIRVNQGLLRTEQQRNSAVLAGLTQERRELQGTTGATNRFAQAGLGLSRVFAGLGIVAAGAGIARLGTNSVQASVKVEGFRNSLTALYGDAQVANTILARLQELAQLPGITFESAVQGAVRLKTVGVEGERAEGVIREFGNAAALAGATTDEVGRSLVGLTQILSRGKVSQEELNQILENLPLIGNSIREAFGSIDAETIRTQLDNAGQGVQDFADILVNQLSMGARASADSTRNAFSNLENATFRLHAAIGDRLSPAVRDATGFLTDLANTTADFVAGTNDATRAATSYADALMTASTAAAVNSAIQERVKFLEQERAGLEAAAAGSANYFEIRGRETDPGRVYREAGEELDGLRAALTNTATAAEHFGNVQNELLSEARRITQDITDLEEQRAGETARAYGTTTRRIREQREALAETQEEIGENAVVLRALASAQTVVTAATEKTTAATKESTAATKEATVEIITYAEAIKQVQANIAAYVEEQELLTDFGTFWEIAAGQADGYSTAIDFSTASVVNHQTELESLLNAGFFDGLDDPIKDYVAALEATSEAADAAFGSINQVGEAIRDADFRAAEGELRDFDDAFQLSEATIPRVTLALHELTGTAPDIEKVERAVESTTRSVDDLLNSVERVPKELDDVGDSADRAERGIVDLDRAFGNLGSNIIDFVADLAGGGGIEDAFADLGLSVADAFVNEFEGVLNERLASTIADALGDGAGAGAGAGGLGGGGAAAGIVSLLTSPVALAAIVPAAVFFATKYIGDQFGQVGTIDDPNRQGRPSQDVTLSDAGGVKAKRLLRQG